MSCRLSLSSSHISLLFFSFSVSSHKLDEQTSMTSRAQAKETAATTEQVSSETSLLTEQQRLQLEISALKRKVQEAERDVTKSYALIGS